MVDSAANSSGGEEEQEEEGQESELFLIQEGNEEEQEKQSEEQETPPSKNGSSSSYRKPRRKHAKEGGGGGTNRRKGMMPMDSSRVHDQQGSFVKQHRLFEDFVIALLHTTNPLPARTSFIFKEEDILEQMLEKVVENCPELVKNRKRFMEAVERIVFSASSGLFMKNRKLC